MALYYKYYYTSALNKNFSASVPLDVSTEVALKEMKQWYSEYKPIDGQMIYDSKEQEARHRYRNKKYEPYAPFFQLESQWKIWSLLREIYPAELRPMLDNIASKIGKDYSKRLGDLSTLYHKYQDVYTTDWIYFSELSDLQDYAPPLTDEEVVQLTKEWIGTEVEHALEGIDFYYYYKHGVRQFFTYFKPFNKAILTPREWLSDPMYWATPGSSYEKRVMVEQNGKRFKTRRSKWGTAMAITLDELYAGFWDPKPQENKVVVKREHKKSRLIVVGDFWNYLRMGYLSYYIENMLRNHPNTPLFYNDAQRIASWITMMDQESPGAPGDPVNAPLDEAKFDHKVNKEMMRIKFDCTEEFLLQHGPQELAAIFSKVFDIMNRSIFSPLGSFSVGVMRLLYVNGLPSGYRWTAFLGTVSNIGKLTAFRNIVLHRTNLDQSYDPVLKHQNQGDDVEAQFRNKYAAQLIFDLYNEAGFEVNQRKTFMSYKNDDFLRNVVLSSLKKVTGYPARGITTLLYRNPINREHQKGENRIQEMAMNWMMVARRTGNFNNIKRMMVEDISRGNSIPKKDVRTFLYTSATTGGFGLSNDTSHIIKWTPQVYKTTARLDDPPMAKSFSDPVLAKKIWAAGVDLGPKVRYELEPYKYSVQKQTPIVPIVPPAVRYASRPFSYPVFDINVRPTEAHIATMKVSEMRPVDLRTHFRPLLTPESQVLFDNYQIRFSHRVFKLWCQKEFDIPTPNIFEQSPFYMGYIAPRVFETIFSNCSTSKIGFNRLQRMRYSSELSTTFTAKATQYSFIM